jgi:hypothetical protein
MKPVTLSARDRRTLIAGASIILSLLLISRGIPAWIRWQERVRVDANATAMEATASQRAVRAAPLLTQTAQQLERRYLALAPAFVTGEQPAAAGATLISAVNAAARTAGVQIGALQVETDTTKGQEVAYVRVRGDGAGDISGITRFLATIEGGVPLLSIRELAITPTDPHITNDKPETMRLNFVIEGLARYERDQDGDDEGTDDQVHNVQGPK